METFALRIQDIVSLLWFLGLTKWETAYRNEASRSISLWKKKSSLENVCAFNNVWKMLRKEEKNAELQLICHKSGCDQFFFPLFLLCHTLSMQSMQNCEIEIKTVHPKNRIRKHSEKERKSSSEILKLVPRKVEH